MRNFREWYVRNQDAITWFLIGWLSTGLLQHLFQGDYGWAAIDAFLIWANYKLLKVRMQ